MLLIELYIAISVWVTPNPAPTASDTLSEYLVKIDILSLPAALIAELITDSVNVAVSFKLECKAKNKPLVILLKNKLLAAKVLIVSTAAANISFIVEFAICSYLLSTATVQSGVIEVVKPVSTLKVWTTLSTSQEPFISSYKSCI